MGDNNRDDYPVLEPWDDYTKNTSATVTRPYIELCFSELQAILNQEEPLSNYDVVFWLDAWRKKSIKTPLSERIVGLDRGLSDEDVKKALSAECSDSKIREAFKFTCDKSNTISYKGGRPYFVVFDGTQVNIESGQKQSFLTAQHNRLIIPHNTNSGGMPPIDLSLLRGRVTLVIATPSFLKKADGREGKLNWNVESVDRINMPADGRNLGLELKNRFQRWGNKTPSIVTPASLVK